MAASGTYLDRILEAHRDRAAKDTRRQSQMQAEALALAPTRGFRAALAASSAEGGIGVIAEVKRASPSKGLLAADLDPSRLALQYRDGGAACLSVLTDEAFFQGSPTDLQLAAAAVDLPVLRKDFTVSERDVLDARLMGADAVLLIVAALDDRELHGFFELATEIGLDSLVEVHDEAEAERAVAIGADLIGVNQRDLVTFAVDTERACRVAPTLPDGVVRVAESGITGADDAQVLRQAGYHAVLVGEHLVRSGDPATAVAALRSAVN